MENCLVTKLKGIVNNPNLPYFNEVHLTWLPYQSSEQSDSYSLAFDTGESAVDVTVAVGCDVYIGEQAYHINAGTTTTCPTNTKCVFAWQKSDWPNVETLDFVILKNVYHLKGFLGKSNANDILYPIMMGLNTPSAGVQPIYEHSEVIIAGIGGGANIAELNFVSSIQKLLITTHLYAESLTLDNVFSLPDIQHIHVQSDVAGYYTRGAYVLNNISKANSRVKYLYGKGSGNLLDIPVNLEWLDTRIGSITGTIEDLVARFRAAGRTSGFIGFYQSDYCDNIKFTYNGEEKSLGALDYSVGGPIHRINAVAWFTWDASSIQIASELPAGAEKYNNVQYPNYNWTPYWPE